VLSGRVGHFGRRFAEVAERFGAAIDYLDFAPGSAADPESLAEAVRRGGYRVVLLTHCETSTGVLNDVTSLSRALDSAAERPLLLIDGVSSLAGAPLGLSDDDYDVVVTASQKAWMAPPGLSMLTVSARGWQRIAACRSPRLYLDLLEARRYAGRGETPWTPGLTLLYGLDVALDLILDEGLPQVYARHRHLAARLRQAMRASGLEVLASEECASPTVTAALLPEGVEFAAVSQHLLAQHQVTVADGQDQLKGRAIRIGHMGYIGDADIDHLSLAIGETMQHVTSRVGR
jgi:aspartate aminotransferase-like enzyme